MQVARAAYYTPETLRMAVEEKLQRANARGERIDYLAFVPDGEPTLDVNLAQHLDAVKPFGIRTAVISNATLIDDPAVRETLCKADWVSLKVDAVDESIWRRIDRPHKSLRLQNLLEGSLQFAKEYAGTLVTETMLVRDLNETNVHLDALAEFVGKLSPLTAYLSIATRPPAESWVLSPTESTIHNAYQRFSKRVEHVETLIGYEGNAFASTGDVREDLLSITSVHPMRQEAVEELLLHANESWEIVQDLIARGLLLTLDYDGHTFYVRKLTA